MDDTREGSRYYINSGKSAGDVGAIWISDYKPLGYTPVTLRNSNATINIENYSTYPYIRGLADTYNSKDNYINYAVLYVWDLKTRAMLSALAQELVKLVDEQTDWDSNSEQNINIAMNSTSLVVTVAGFVWSVFLSILFY